MARIEQRAREEPDAPEEVQRAPGGVRRRLPLDAGMERIEEVPVRLEKRRRGHRVLAAPDRDPEPALSSPREDVAFRIRDRDSVEDVEQRVEQRVGVPAEGAGRQRRPRQPLSSVEALDRRDLEDGRAAPGDGLPELRKEIAHRLGQRLAVLGGRHVVRARREVADAGGFA